VAQRHDSAFAGTAPDAGPHFVRLLVIPLASVVEQLATAAARQAGELCYEVDQPALANGLAPAEGWLFEPEGSLWGNVQAIGPDNGTAEADHALGAHHLEIVWRPSADAGIEGSDQIAGIL